MTCKLVIRGKRRHGVELCSPASYASRWAELYHATDRNLDRDGGDYYQFRRLDHV
jgi:hypothetical protein